MPDSPEDKNTHLVENRKLPASKDKDRKKSGDPKPGEPGGGSGWARRNIVLLIAVVAASILLVNLLESGNRVEEKTYSEFRRLVSDTAWPVTAVTLTRVSEGYELTGERRATVEEAAAERGLKGPSAGSDLKPVRFKTMLPDVEAPVNEILKALEARGIKVQFAQATRWFTLFTTFLPLLLIILFFWFLSARQSGQMGGPRGLFSFGKIKPRVSDENRPKVTFKDVSGCDEAKQELHEVIDFLKDPGRFSRLGGRIPKGVLLLGPPGTGKTLLAKAVAGEAEVPFFSMSGSDFVEMFVGVGASRVRDLFEQSKKNAPCIIFIDEIDAVGRQRGAGLGGGHDEREQTLNQLLVEMDGFSANDGVILIAATNRPDVLDPALLRPGRFDRQVIVDLPDSKGREGILRVHLDKRKVPLADDIDVSRIAKGTPGLSGADLENLVNEACLLAARFGSDKVSMLDFEEAKDKVMIGTERVSRIIGEEEKRTTAYHEAGHAIVSLNVKYADPLHKITIIPRGRALGITFQLPEKDTYTVDSRFVLDKIAILMGGRGAELLMFNQMNTGASNDIERATELARKYVCEWGMSELGPISYGKKQEEIFLGREIAQHRDYSEATAVEIDRVVRGLVEDQMKRVIALLTEHRQDLVNLAEAVLEHETLEADEVALAIKGELTGGSRKSRAFVKGRAVLEAAKAETIIAPTSETLAVGELPTEKPDTAV
jgi:cell division protease FtsH